MAIQPAEQTEYVMMKWIFCVMAMGLPMAAAGQMFFVTNQGLFERINGRSVQVPTGLTAPLYPSLSRDGWYISFSRPDLTNLNGVNPSSDLVVLDRFTGNQRTVIDNNTLVIGADFDILSSQVSPSGQVIAYGLRIGPASGVGLSATTDLAIADLTTGVDVSNPFSNRINEVGPTSDVLSAEFRGISFFPDSDSFVTPVLGLIVLPGSAIGDAVTAITRFDRNITNGQWFAAASLSTPRAEATAFIGTIPIDVAVNYQVYPAISPNGGQLAYFDVAKPNRTGALESHPSTSRVVVANADGGNQRELTRFAPGFLPSGLTWTTDGTTLVVSISQQVNPGTGYIDLTDSSNSAVFSVPIATGTATAISELGNGFAPTLPATRPVHLSDLVPRLSQNEDGSFTFRAMGLPVRARLDLEQSLAGSPSGFTRLRPVTGGELATGIVIPSGPDARFFRLAQPGGG